MSYVNRLTQATQTDNIVDGSERLQFWKEVVDDKSRGWYYETVGFPVNIQYEMSSLTQVKVLNQNIEAKS